MRLNFARLESCKAWVAAALSLLLAACTTTTTITSSDEPPHDPAASAPRSSAAAAAASRDYVVRPGDTLYAIAFRNRVDLRELIAWNRLSEPYTIYPGQRLRIVSAPMRDDALATRASPAAPSPVRTEPREPQPRPVEAATQARPVAASPDRSADPSPGTAATPAAGGPDAHAGTAVASTQSSPRTAAADATPVASMPAIPIAVDEGVQPAVVEEPALAPATPAAAPLTVAVRTPAVPPPLPQTPAEPQRDGGPIRAAPTRMAGGIGWRWPSSATLVGRFAPDDEARQGIRLQGPAGMPVAATADGEVVYSGNGLVGLGELVIIKHGSEYLSAYGLNRKRLVTEGQKVVAGQPVAEMGNSAGVAGLLHFEVRRNGRPVDPLTVLPPR